MNNILKKIKLSDVVADFIVPMRDKPKVFNGNVPWCRIEDFDGIYLSKSKSDRCVDEKTIKEMKLRVYPVGTVLVSCSADLGRCAITSAPLVTNQTFIGLVPSEKIDALFLYYLMKYNSQKLNNLSSGTTIAYLSRRQFENFTVSIPPDIKIQKKIAQIMFSLDRSISLANQQAKKTELLKEGFLNDILSGKVKL